MFERDGYTQSIWQKTCEPYIPLNTVNPDELYDVIIVGGGITGISTAYLLQKSGLRCLILEAYNVCFGTTGGTTAHLNTLLDTPYTTIAKNFGMEKTQLVLQSVQDAITLIKKNISDLNIDCDFRDVTGYLWASDKKQEQELTEIVNVSRQAGLDIQPTNGIPVNRKFLAAAAFPGQGQFNPIPYAMTLAEAFEKLGGSVLLNSRVTEVNDEGDILKVYTSDKCWKARKLIYATHIPPGVNLLHLRCTPWRSYALAVTLSDDNYPDNLCYDLEDPYHYYRTQLINGKKFLIVGGKDHKTGQEENTDKPFQLLKDHTRKYFAVKEIVNYWSSQYYESADGLPYIGLLPGKSDRIYVATGFGGNGMVYSSVAAILFRDLLTSQSSPYEKLYEPGRIKPIAGFTAVMQHNTDVIKEYFKKIIPFEKIDSHLDIPPGEGKLVRLDDQSIALSKDMDAGIHAVSPVCTHLHCEVKWNVAEQSWDCPCHGARYNPDGKVLNGPAYRDLETIPIDGRPELLSPKRSF